MLLGPVFRAELLRTARRKRYYAARFFYGLLLLAILWLGYEGETSGTVLVTIDQAASYAQNAFIRFAVVQLVAILLLIPALFGGSIADEKQRKTLHYLMASELSSFEIVLDKILGRAPHVAVFLAMGLPVVSLLGLIGGIPPEYAVGAFIGTVSTASMAIAMTVLVSTLSRKVRQAVLVSYVLVLAWQFVPFIVTAAGSRLFVVAYSWVEPVNTLIGSTSPLWVLFKIEVGGGRLVETLAWMLGLQIGASALMILLAVWRLRPTFRRQESTQPRRKWFEGRKNRPARPRRWWDRPACGEDAMAWKERHFSRTDVFTKMVVLPATVFVSVVLVLYVGIDESILRAFSEFWTRGFRGMGSNEAMVEHLRVVSAWYFAIWLLAVAGASASSVAVEREEDTWISLTSTPLTGWEILRGKVLGAIWAQRGFAAIPIGLWTIGLVTGSVHPLGFLGAVVAFGVASWMVASVGIHASLRASTTSKALVSTIVTLAILYGYPIFLLRSFVEYRVWDQYTSYVGFPARVAVGPLMTSRDVDEFLRITFGPGITHYEFWPQVLFGMTCLAINAAVAGILTYRSVIRFDRWLDRPRIVREAPTRTPSLGQEVAEPVLQS